MERINAKFHSDAFERRDGDIIVRIPFLATPEQEIYLFLLLEFQSTIDPWMALRFGTYAHLLYEQLMKEHKLSADGRLPPVFPLLLYMVIRRGRWRASLCIRHRLQCNIVKLFDHDEMVLVRKTHPT